MEALNGEIHQVFVKSLDGKHKVLNFDTPFITVSALKHRIQTLTSVPSHLQLLSNNSRILHEDQSINLTPSCKVPLFPNSDGFQFGEGKFPMVVDLLLRLRGGKGGFGSLLRGAATKAGQKKTNNFDACRDMSGRRLRHVNAEKKLEEWRAEADERKLEKMAEDFLKKNAKEVAKSGKRNGSDSAEKYVAKYREQSAKCMEKVEKSVRESVKEALRSKRKDTSVANESDSKRRKIWLGKKTFNESDSEDSEEDDNGEPKEVEDEKSVIIDNGSQSDSSKEANTSSGSITGRVRENEVRDQGSSKNGSEEEEIFVEKSLTSGTSPDGSFDAVKSTSTDNLEENIDHGRVDSDSKMEVTVNQLPGDSASEMGAAPCAEVNTNFQPEAVQEESVSKGIQVNLDKPLNFDEYHSAAELEVLGIERLKTELQSRGLKCGGTLSERAARLFLLKTTPLHMLPKKLFAKK